MNQASEVDPWYLDHLVCSVDGTKLDFDGRQLTSNSGRRYPIIDGIPIMLLADREQTIGVANASIARTNDDSHVIDRRLPHLYLETLGISEVEKDQLVRIVAEGTNEIDPVALMLIGATSGYAYKHLIGNTGLRTYPIPRFSLPNGQGRILLDVGCNWGRWSIAAARAGYKVVGIDPSLGAVMALRRIARELSLDVRCVVGDARWLPFPKATFDAVYSYSVLQHFPKEDARRALAEVGRVLRTGGFARIQMANRVGLRSMQHQLRRRFREPQGFEVRYWSIREMRAVFEATIGPTRVTSDCYFGLGWQWEDVRYMPLKLKAVLLASEALRRASDRFPPLRSVADSVFCTATCRQQGDSRHRGS